MLTENDVVRAVAAHLRSEGYRIDQERSTMEHGVDIIASKQTPPIRLLVEAKGGTSSKPDTNRYEKGFSPDQVQKHVAVAFFYAASLYQRYSDPGTRIAVAFPDDRNHRKRVEQIRMALERLEIAVFLVDDNLRVVTY